MKMRLRSEEAIGLECAWPAPAGATAPAPPVPTRHWPRRVAGLIVFAALAYLGWRLGMAGWPDISLALRAAG